MLSHWFSWLVIFLGGLGTIAFGLNRVWRLWIVPAFHFLRRLWFVANRFVDAAPVVVVMAEQFRNNGGSTLKDAIDGLKSTSDKHTKTLETQNESLATLKATTTRVEAKVDMAINQRPA